MLISLRLIFFFACRHYFFHADATAAVYFFFADVAAFRCLFSLFFICCFRERFFLQNTHTNINVNTADA